MSPSESDLRATLHDGEGDGLDADELIRRGRARVAQRRTRLLSGTAIVAVVAGTGVAAALLSGGGGGGPQAGSGHRTAAGAARSAPSHGATAFGARQSGARADAAAGNQVPGAGGLAPVRCPVARPQYALPGGGSPGQFGAGGPLFDARVSSAVVCGYGAAVAATGEPRPHPARLTLSGRSADRLVASLDHAARTAPNTACAPSLRHTYDFAIIGVTSDGRRTKTLSAQLTDPPCGGIVTNGTALRFAWAPPHDLRSRLLALVPNPRPESVLPSPTK